MSYMISRYLIIATLISLQTGFMLPSMAAPKPSTPSKSKTRRSVIRWMPPPPPPNLGDPGDRGQGGGSRGSCLPYKDVSALLPRSQWGLTTLAHPTIWLNAPKGIAANVPLEFVLQNAAGKTLFKERIDAAATSAGTTQIPFPAAAPALQVNQQYRWSIAIYCDAEVPDQPLTVRGGISRSALSPTATEDLAKAKTAIEQAAIYAEEGIWYDSLTTLGPELGIPWQDLLEQANQSHDR
jgi:Domain of Unknown Function (DUF928)